MELSYSLSAEDFLVYQMHASAKSKIARRRRLLGQLFVIAAFLLVGIRQLSNDRLPNAIVSFGCAGSVVVAYPLLSKWIHRRHFKKFIAENYQNRTGSVATLRLEEEGMLSANEDGEGMLKHTAIDELVEIETLWLIKLKAGVSLLLPKAEIGEAKLGEFMKLLARRSGIELSDERGKRWR